MPSLCHETLLDPSAVIRHLFLRALPHLLCCTDTAEAVLGALFAPEEIFMHVSVCIVCSCLCTHTSVRIHLKAISGYDAEKAAQWFILPGLHSMSPLGWKRVLELLKIPNHCNSLMKPMWSFCPAFWYIRRCLHSLWKMTPQKPTTFELRGTTLSSVHSERKVFPFGCRCHVLVGQGSEQPDLLTIPTHLRRVGLDEF